LRSCTETLNHFFPFVHWFYAHPFPLYFSEAFKHGDFIIISSESDTQLGNPLGIMLFALVHFRVFRPITVAHRTCISLLLVDDTHIYSWSCFKHVTCFFAITRGFWSIRIFSVVEEVCSLASTWVRPIYITFSRFSCTWIWSSYYRCSNRVFAICGVLCKRTSGRLLVFLCS
jgi:hypothetical protein